MRSQIPEIDWNRMNQRVKLEGPIMLAIPLKSYSRKHDCRAHGCEAQVHAYVVDEGPPVLHMPAVNKGLLGVVHGYSRLHREVVKRTPSIDILYLGEMPKREALIYLLRRDIGTRVRPAASLATILSQLAPVPALIDITSIARGLPLEELQPHKLVRRGMALAYEAVRLEVGVEAVEFRDLVRMLEAPRPVVDMLYDEVLSDDAVTSLAVVEDPRKQFQLAVHAAQENWSVSRLQAEILRAEGAVPSREDAERFWARWVPNLGGAERPRTLDPSVGDEKGGAQ